MPYRLGKVNVADMSTAVALADPRRGVSTVLHPLAARVLDVVHVEDLSPLMRRVVLKGDQVASLPFLPWAATDHIKIVLPDADGHVAVPRIEDGRAHWDDFTGITRDYTVRTVKTVTNELTLDGVVHAHGPAGRWFLNAAPGARLGILGPRGSHLYPPGYGHSILVADETALPALGRWLDQPGLRTHLTVIAVASTPDPYPLPQPGRRSTVDWRPHVLSDPLKRGSLLAQEVTEALRTSPCPHDVFVWAAGEAGAMRSVREALRDAGLPRYAMDVDGYWRIGTANLDHHAERAD